MNITFELANNILLSKTLNVHPDYKEILNEVYRVQPLELDFSKSKEASKIINEWVANKTHNKITELLSPGKIKKLKF